MATKTTKEIKQNHTKYSFDSNKGKKKERLNRIKNK